MKMNNLSKLKNGSSNSKKVLNTLLFSLAVSSIFYHLEVRSELSDAVVNAINAPLIAAGANPVALGDTIPNPISRSRANLSAIMYRAARTIAGGAVAPVVIGGIHPGTVAVGNINFNNAALASEQTIAAIHTAGGANLAAKTVLANAAPPAGIANNRERSLFRHLVNVRHLWKWPIAGVPANPNLNYLAWCRAARIQNGVHAGGLHSSFFVPNGTNANAYFALLLERIATAAANANNVIVAHNGANITPIPGGFPGGAPALAPAPGGGNHIVQIFVNITGAAQIGGAAIQGIKCSLIGGPLPAALSTPAPLAPAFIAVAMPIPQQLEASTSKREALYIESMTNITGAAPIANAFMVLHGGGVQATAAAPQNVNVVEVRIEQRNAPHGFVHTFSIYPK